jgi:nuclear pore complex protein Nup214
LLWKLKYPSIFVFILAGSNQQESVIMKNSSLVSKKQETTGNSLLTSSDKKPLDTKQLNVPTALATAPSLALTGNTKPAMSFSFSTVNNEGTNPTGSKAPSGLAPSLQPGSSSFGNSQSGKRGLDSTQSVGTFGGSQNSNKDGGGYSLKSSLFASSGSVPAKIGESNEAGFGNPSPQTSYTVDGKVFGPPVALSPGPLPSISPAKPSLIGSSSSGYRAGNSEAPQSLHGSPLSQQTMGKSHNSRTQAPVEYSRNSKMSAIFDSQEDVSKKFYSVRSLNALVIIFIFLSFTFLVPMKYYHQCKENFK